MRHFSLLVLVGIGLSLTGYASEIKKSNPWDIRTPGATVVLEETVATEAGYLFPVGTVFISIDSKKLSNTYGSVQNYEVRLERAELNSERKQEITIKCKVYDVPRHSIECDVKYFALNMRN